MTVPPLLCEHPLDRAKRSSFRLVCGVCGSYWDLDSRGVEPVYDERYPEERGHYDSRVGALKVRTLRRWLRQTNVRIDRRVVCEVGFGGGSCLPFLATQARRVLGIEANASAVARVRDAGAPAELLLANALPQRLADPVDLWIFQDSFEHVPDVAGLLDWMQENSADSAEILMVLPRGDSISQRLMGRLWPHKLPDHHFQWSRAGLIQFFAKRGLVPRTEFYPLKFASPQMVVAHALHKAGAPHSVRRWLGGTAVALLFNFGEMGFVFHRSSA